MDCITISKENLYTYSAKMRTLSGAYSGFTRDMVRDIVGKALYDFVVEENKKRSENNERTVKSEHSRIYQR